jgi:hypothetical protein
MEMDDFRRLSGIMWDHEIIKFGLKEASEDIMIIHIFLMTLRVFITVIKHVLY